MPYTCHVVPSSRYVCIAIEDHGGVSNLLDLSTHAHQTFDRANFDDHVYVRYCLDVAEVLAAILSLRNWATTGVGHGMAYELHCSVAESLEPSQSGLS